ncbi:MULTISPECIES: hypothetical protein [Streptomyces]|uniref:hypothetical protein n=1 Tax=Streptomyces TaxID=1883 RepID=UPI001864BDE0|nr:hypothetical protein [Streptomyces sp. TSRI0384-2]
MSEAWTEADTTCADQASQEVTGGVAPYWHSYAYDKTGNRTSETLHDLTGDSAKDTKRVYTYPVAGTAQSHTLTEVNEAGPHGTSRTSYAYDANGNTTERLIQGDRQKLTWDPEGHLSKIAQPVEGKPDDITEYLYDAEGNRLIERGPDRTTLTVGNTELVLPKNGSQPTATRYLDLGNGSQAVQTDNGKISFCAAPLLEDAHGVVRQGRSHRLLPGREHAPGEAADDDLLQRIPFGVGVDDIKFFLGTAGQLLSSSR